MAAAEPLTWAGVPRAGWTYYLGSSYGLAKLIGASRVLRGMLGLVAALIVVAVAVSDRQGVVVAMTALLFVLVVPAFGLLGAYAVVVIRLTMPASRIWTAPDRSIVLAARHTGSDTLRAAEFTAWPVGQHRTRPFLTELLRQVDRDQLAITATAANNQLHTAIYADHGFIITKAGSRPKIRRDPKPVATDADRSGGGRRSES